MTLRESITAVFNCAFNLEGTKTTVTLDDGTQVTGKLTRDSVRSYAKKFAHELITVDKIFRREDFEAENERILKALTDEFGL